MTEKGVITFIGDEQQITDKLTKRIFVIEKTNGQYTDQIAVELINQRVDLVDPYRVGDNVEVSLNIQSREYNGKWYTSVSAWKIEKVSERGTSASPVAAPSTAAPEDDLPF